MANMEKRIFLIFFTLFLVAGIIAQTSEQNQIRFKLWYEMNEPLALPEQNSIANIEDSKTSEIEESGYKYSINAIHQIVPFILEGTLYGWNFNYTPSDKIRNVSEYFELSAIHTILLSDPQISYDSPLITDSGNNFSCWITYSCTKYQKELLEYRESINLPKISGKGSSAVQNETDGIKKAFTEAAKNAIREYYRTIIKNKPKEITGSVYLIGDPRYYIDEGNYIADLDFYLEKGTILQYIYF